MVVTFHTKAYADITMLGDVAIKLLKLMGHSGAVPSAILPEDIPEALQRLRTAIAGAAEDRSGSVESEEPDEPPIPLKNRAFPLIELFEAAHRAQVPVTWEA